MFPPMVEDPRGEELTHLGRVRCSRGGVKASLLISPDHQGFVDMPTAVRQWSSVIAGCIKARPPAQTKITDALDVAQQSSRFLPVYAGKLALMSSHCPKLARRQGFAKFWELPDAGRFASVGPAKVLRMLK